MGVQNIWLNKSGGRLHVLLLRIKHGNLHNSLLCTEWREIPGRRNGKSVQILGLGVVIPSERVQIWVRLFLCGLFYPCVRHKFVCVCVICVLSPHSNGAIQTRVGVELADNLSVRHIDRQIMPIQCLASQCCLAAHVWSHWLTLPHDLFPELQFFQGFSSCYISRYHLNSSCEGPYSCL